MIIELFKDVNGVCPPNPTAEITVNEEESGFFVDVFVTNLKVVNVFAIAQVDKRGRHCNK